jgi:hypothetical protein
VDTVLRESESLTLKARCDLSEHRTPRTGNAVGAPIGTSTNTAENESKSYNKMKQKPHTQDGFNVPGIIELF